MAKKFEQVQQILHQRIRRGDYLLKDLPPERDLAREVGVSRMTARKAMQRLVKQGLLSRSPSGRLIQKTRDSHAMRIAFLIPSIVSPSIENWRLALDKISDEFNAMMRTIMFLHWDDPLIVEALDGFDAAFVYPSCESIPDYVVQHFQRPDRHVIILEQDLTALGLPSICGCPSSHVGRLLDQLLPWCEQGVDCFNVQTMDSVIEGRIRQWNVWRAAHRLPGNVLGNAVPPYGIPIEQGYHEMLRLIDENQLKCKGLLCTTSPAAIGAARAMFDSGIVIGRDIGLVVINDENLGRYYHPSMTCLQMPDPTPYLRMCMEWFAQPECPWVGPLLVEPVEPCLFIGESTQKAPSTV